MERKITLMVFVLSSVLVLAGFSIPDAESTNHPLDDGISSPAPEDYVGVAVVSTAVSTDGTWFEFSITDISRGCFPADPAGPSCTPSTGTPTTFVGAPAWTFTCPSGGCALTVTDAFDYGDQFDVFDNAIPIGTTTLSPFSGQCSPNNTDPEDCLLDPKSSSGVFPLASGTHSITILNAPTANFPGGAHYFKVQGQIPVGGSDVSINTSALLLAGVESVSMWMIPVILAGIGIGIFVIKRRN